MRRALTIGLLAIPVGLFAASCAAHHDDFALGSSPQPVDGGPPSVDSPIGDLLANPAAKAVLTKDLPDLLAYNGLDQIEGMSIRQISTFHQAGISKKDLATVQADLSGLPKRK